VTAEPVPEKARRRLTRPRLAFGGALVAVAAATATVLATGGGAGPAYAITTEKDGTLAVAVNRVDDPADANRQLTAADDRVRILRPSAPEDCPEADRGTPADSPLAVAVVKMDGVTRKGARIGLRPEGIPDGIVMVLVVYTLSGNDAPAIRLAAYQAPGPKCVIAPTR
jgi:hypothetical protein